MLLPLMAQNNTNSPYTRFGYGDLGERSFGAGRAMGGVGYGLRSPKQINPMNPASYSCMDSLTFLFDFGVAGQLSWFDDGNARQNDINGNVEYIAMQFPIHRRIALSFGLLPYSYVGYKFGALRNDEGVTFTETYNGSGGLSDFYGGVSIDIWKKRLAVGANFGFLFGNMFSILYSLAGGLLSFLVMYLLKKTKWFGVLPVSVSGGIFHNVGQLVVAAYVVENYNIFYYMPVLLIAGALTGFLVGIAAQEMIKRIGKRMV